MSKIRSLLLGCFGSDTVTVVVYKSWGVDGATVSVVVSTLDPVQVTNRDLDQCPAISILCWQDYSLSEILFQVKN